MQTKGNLFTRADTIFGVCEGLGEDLGVPSNLLRIALALMLFWSPTAAAITYGVGAVILLATRLLIPNRRAAATPQRAALPEPVGNDDDAYPTATAA